MLAHLCVSIPSSYHIKDMKPLCETISKLLIKSESTDYNVRNVVAFKYDNLV